jgi:hypothetical protein
MGGQVVGELRVEGESHAVTIDRNGSRAGGVNANAHYILRDKPRHVAGGRDRLGDGGVESFDIVCRVLAGEIGIDGIQEHTSVTAPIVADVGGDFGAAIYVDDQGADTVGSVVDSDGKSSFCRTLHSRLTVD